MTPEARALGREDVREGDMSLGLDDGQDVKQTIELALTAIGLDHLALPGIAQEAYCPVQADEVLRERGRNRDPVLGGARRKIQPGLMRAHPPLSLIHI